MNATAALFDAGEIVAQPGREAARVKVSLTGEGVTSVAGAVSWGPLLDRNALWSPGCTKHGKAISTTSYFEIDDLIDPADSR